MGRFEYLTGRIRLTPRDLPVRPQYLHFVCSSKRAQEIVDEIDAVDGWEPVTIFEPIPVRW